jgi:hypothetical protein
MLANGVIGDFLAIEMTQAQSDVFMVIGVIALLVGFRWLCNKILGVK